MHKKTITKTCPSTELVVENVVEKVQIKVIDQFSHENWAPLLILTLLPYHTIIKNCFVSPQGLTLLALL